MAFGDSITEGKIDDVLVPSLAYPTDLLAMLSARYTAQTIGIINEGCGGERVSEEDDDLGPCPSDEQPHYGIQRLVFDLNAAAPQVVLIQEGINDLIGGGGGAIGPLVDALTRMVREAQAAGARVFIGTLLPVTEGGDASGAFDFIQPVNADIQVIAQGTGATLVDLNAAFGGTANAVDIGNDGLHPTAAGYQLIAQTFFSAIKATIEVVQAPTGNAASQKAFGLPAPAPRPHR